MLWQEANTLFSFNFYKETEILKIRIFKEIYTIYDVEQFKIFKELTALWLIKKDKFAVVIF